MIPTVGAYVEQAAELARGYEGLVLEEVHRLMLGLIPARARCVLDVGQGQGVMPWIEPVGHQVVSVKLVVEFRALGNQLHVTERIVWVDDVLPTLARIKRWLAWRDDPSYA